MYNKVILIGNLTRDIELRYSQSGSAVASTGLAVTRKYTSNGERKEETTFVDVTFFGRTGEIANQYLRKGSKILVEGRLSLDRWVDSNGGKRNKLYVVAEDMKMLDNRSSGQPNSQDYAENGMEHGRQQPEMTYESVPKGSSRDMGANMPYNTVPQIDLDEEEVPF